MTKAELQFLEDMKDELKFARAKFPNQDVWITLAALTEEVGELNSTILEYYQEPNKGRTLDDIRNEAVQVAAMAMRVIFDTRMIAK